MPDLSIRSTDQERMDDLSVSGGDLFQALRELDGINYLLGGNYVTLRGINELMTGTPARVWHIADLGCGSGDILRRIRQMTDRKGVRSQLYGVDANPNVIAYARAHTPDSCGITYIAEDIFSSSFQKRRFDIVTATLFFHHFHDQELVLLLSRLRESVSVGIVINDIHRHWFAYYAIKMLTRLLSKSPMVKHDAPVSVLRAFTRHDLERVLRQAGFKRFTIRWRWAFRWQVIVRL